MMDLKQLSDRCVEHTVRIESMICLAAAINDDEISEALSDLLEDSPEVLNRCFDDFPLDRVEEALELRHRQDAQDIFLDWSFRHSKLGFLLEFCTPVMEHRSDTVHSYSWGYRRSHWVYGDTFEQAVDSGFAWVAEQRAAEAAEAQEGA